MVWIEEFLNEAKNNACVNFVAVSPLHVVGYHLTAEISADFEERGGKALSVPVEQMIRGNAGPHV